MPFQSLVVNSQLFIFKITFKIKLLVNFYFMNNLLSEIKLSRYAKRTTFLRVVRFFFCTLFFPCIKREKVVQLTRKTGYYAVPAHLIFVFFLDLNGVDWNCIPTKNESSV